MEIYPDKPLGNVLQIAMPRAPRLYAPGRTMQCSFLKISLDHFAPNLYISPEENS
jgi:hypothetical protein